MPHEPCLTPFAVSDRTSRPPSELSVLAGSLCSVTAVGSTRIDATFSSGLAKAWSFCQGMADPDFQ
jgi:hypothetical protein